MMDLFLCDGWADDEKHPPICAGCGRIVHPDDIDDYMLCRQCLLQLNGQQVSWTTKKDTRR